MYTNSKPMVNKKDKFRYPVYSARVDEELKDWLKEQQKKYKSQNLFFKELKKRYESSINRKIAN